MNSSRRIIGLSVLLVALFSFIEKESIAVEIKLNLEDINVISMLSNQIYECRPSSEFMFYVETALVKKHRGANTINASIFVLDRVTGATNLLASENILVPAYKDAISLHHNKSKNDCEKVILHNGDKVLGSAKNTPYCFNKLIKFGSIFRSYKKSKKELLNFKNL